MSTPPDAKTRPSRTINQNPDAMPPLSKAIPLGLQHIMAMFAGNVTPPIIIAGVIGANPAEQIFLIQVALFVAGVSTLVQTIGIGPIGARWPRLLAYPRCSAPRLWRGCCKLCWARF